MNKTLVILSIIGMLISCSNPEKVQESSSAEESHAGHLGETEKDNNAKKPLSPRTAAMTNIGSNHLHIDYGSPSKRGRMIFGGLVGFGTVWATGAHKATWIDFSEDVIINETEIAAGKYGLFTIPGETEWIIIISKDWDMHLADDYVEANDIVRVTSKVQSLDDEVESLTFELHEIDESSGRISIQWDQTFVTFDVNNK